jgi:uncharacterized protein YbjT (DUF2867 family)
MHTLVVGAESLLGRNVIPRLLANGYNVRTVVRQLGVDAIVGNPLDRESLHQAAFYTGREEEWWQALAT